MCFGGGGNVPDPQPAPAPAPTPVPTEVSPIQSQQERTSKLASMRMGLASTIKTSPAGVTGSGPELSIAALYPKMPKNNTGS